MFVVKQNAPTPINQNRLFSPVLPFCKGENKIGAGVYRNYKRQRARDNPEFMRKEIWIA